MYNLDIAEEKNKPRWSHENGQEITRLVERVNNLVSLTQRQSDMIDHLQNRLKDLEDFFFRAHALPISECTVGLKDEHTVYVCSNCGVMIPIKK